MTFQFDERAMRKLEQQVAQKLQPEVNERVRAAIRRVRDSYSGEDVDTVYRRLVEEITTSVGPITPNEAELRQVAEAITKGELTG